VRRDWSGIINAPTAGEIKIIELYHTEKERFGKRILT